MRPTHLLPLLGVVVVSVSVHTASAQYSGWHHAGSIHILTTAEGADLPASASEEGFPVLVRLHRDFFDFSQTRALGEDIRFATSGGTPLAYQIEEWEPRRGVVNIWVRLPKISGNTRQEIRLHWGHPTAASESSGAAVFNESNGYLSVCHMNEPVRDEVGALEPQDRGTESAAGVIGPARRFPGAGGVFFGERIAGYPAGSDPHTSEAWLRAEQGNGTVLAWGNEQAQGKVVMQFRSPPHISMDCYFSDGNVRGTNPLPLAEWVHVVHTYRPGNSRVYVNGILDTVATTRAAPLAIKRPARMWIGGWYDHYDFVGDIDEVRISRVARSADWVKLQYENQKPLPTLAGPVVPPGTAFSVAPAQVTVEEGSSTTLYAEAGGALKIYWVLKRDGREQIVAVDRLSFTLEAGRVVGDQAAILQFRAICADAVKTQDIPITIREDIPEPVLTLKAPATWNGRKTIEVTPQVTNRRELEAKGADQLDYAWTVSDIAVIRETLPGKLILKRAHKSGTLTVTATVHNGGAPTTHATTIAVTEPARDPWIARAAAPEERPQDNRFYARDDRDEGTLSCRGTLPEPADAVFLRLHADGKLARTERRRLAADKSYTLSVKLKPGLIRYAVAFGCTTDGRETVLHTATNLVCGDAYLIDGQSNAEATDLGPNDPAYTSDWIRSFGSMAGDPDGARLRLWGNAVARDRDGGKLQIGYWGLELARRLVENHRMPICIINGAVGGSRIDQHQPNSARREDVATIYGRLLWRVQQAGLTHGIRGVLWHQGENDQGADGPTGRYGWETYQQYFVDLAAAWKEDYPNLQNYYLFQIWPKACAMGFNGSDNRLREVQRTLPSLFSNLGIMSTVGIKPPGGCHFPLAGYAEIARLICPLIERDHYGKGFPAAITPPNLLRAYYATNERDEVALEFDQSMAWNDALASQFYLDGESGKVAAGRAAGSVVTLKLPRASAARTITYLDSQSWSVDNLLYGENGMAALTFCEAPILGQGPLP